MSDKLSHPRQANSPQWGEAGAQRGNLARDRGLTSRMMEVHMARRVWAWASEVCYSLSASQSSRQPEGRGLLSRLSQLITCPSSGALIFQPEEAITVHPSPRAMLFHARGMRFPCARVPGPHPTFLFHVGSPSRVLVSAKQCWLLSSGGLQHLFLGFL